MVDWRKRNLAFIGAFAMKEHNAMPFDRISVGIVFLTIFNHLSLTRQAKLSMASCRFINGFKSILYKNSMF